MKYICKHSATGYIATFFTSSLLLSRPGHRDRSCRRQHMKHSNDLAVPMIPRISFLQTAFLQSYALQELKNAQVQLEFSPQALFCHISWLCKRVHKSSLVLDAVITKHKIRLLFKILKSSKLNSHISVPQNRYSKADNLSTRLGYLLTIYITETTYFLFKATYFPTYPCADPDKLIGKIAPTTSLHFQNRSYEYVLLLH